MLLFTNSIRKAESTFLYSSTTPCIVHHCTISKSTSNCTLYGNTACTTIEMRPMWTQKMRCGLKLLVPTASHSTSNHLSAHQKWQLVEAPWTTSLKNSRGGTLMSPNWLFSRPRLYFNVRSMNITYRGSRQAALSECDAQLNVLDSGPNTQTELSPGHRVNCSRHRGCSYCPECSAYFTSHMHWLEDFFKLLRFCLMCNIRR